MSFTQKQQLVLITTILTLFLTAFYLLTSKPYQSNRTETVNRHTLTELDRVHSSVCDKVDILWLASDREYWDGLSDKIMFMRRDGTLVTGTVYIDEGDDVCVVVLLAPTPAMAAIKNENHIGPQDIITVTAVGDTSRQSIHMVQHAIQPNAYYSSVQFNHPDSYKLHAVDEFRSYFYEKPILHIYRPNLIYSPNRLIVLSKSIKQTQPTCKHTHSQFMKGSWIDAAVYKENNPDIFQAMYDNNEYEFMENGRVYVPNDCNMTYTGVAQGSHCLGKQTIHVWGDNHTRRNMMALSPDDDWCNLESIQKMSGKKKQQEMKCVCHDVGDEAKKYPWITNASIPIRFTNSWDVNAHLYYHQIPGTILNHSVLASIMQLQINALPQADTVIIGIGNNDIEGIRITPESFQESFRAFIHRIRTDLYPTQTLIIKTPQYFSNGTLRSTAWNSGRSLTFNMIVQDTVKEYNNILIWDVYSLGVEDNTCLPERSSYTRRNVINLENQHLWRLLCPTI